MEGHRQAFAVQRTDSVRTLPPTPPENQCIHQWLRRGRNFRRRALQWTASRQYMKALIRHNVCRQRRMTPAGGIHHHFNLTIGLRYQRIQGIRQTAAAQTAYDDRYERLAARRRPSGSRPRGVDESVWHCYWLRTPIGSQTASLFQLRTGSWLKQSQYKSVGRYRPLSRVIGYRRKSG